MSLLQVKDIDVNFGSKQILKDINLNFEKGKLYGVLGPNGAGKSTLFSVMTKLTKPERGTIFLDGNDIKDFSAQALAQQISTMSQNFNMEFPYTVQEIVAMGRYPFSSGYLDKVDNVKLNRALMEADLQGINERKVSELSGGERQRVLFGKTLCQDTEIMLIDEGFNNMDIYYQIQFIKLLREKVQKENKLIIFIMHELIMARKYCDEILLMKNGEVYDFGKSEKVLNDKALYEVFKVHGKFVNYSLEFI